MIMNYAPLVAVALMVLPPSASAQTNLPEPFEVRGALDLIVAIDGTPADDPLGSHLTTSDPLWLTGWTVECRSGLQPQTQRLGQFSAYWTRRSGPLEEVQRSTILAAPIIVERQDVAKALSPSCSAVGPHVGYWILVTPPSEWGIW